MHSRPAAQEFPLDLPLESSQENSQRSVASSCKPEPVASSPAKPKASSKRPVPEPSHASKKPKVETEVKQEAPDASRWVRWTGSCLHIELGGRRIKDNTAAAVAKLMTSVLTKIRARQKAPEVSLNLSGNRLGKDGLMVLLQAVEGSHVVSLDLQWNRIDAGAAMWLSSWMCKQPGGPPARLLLSHNRGIGEVAAQHLLEKLRGRPWVEAKYVGIRDVDPFLELLSTQAWASHVMVEQTDSVTLYSLQGKV